VACYLLLIKYPPIASKGCARANRVRQGTVGSSVLHQRIAPDSGCLSQDPGAGNGVVSVLDGDTIEVLHNNRAERIRLNGIDCPEIGQAPGTTAVPHSPKGITHVSHWRLDVTCSSAVQGESGFARPRDPSHTSRRCRTEGMNDTDAGIFDLYREKRPGGPPLRRAILPHQLAYAPAFSAVGTIRCERRGGCWYLPHAEGPGSHKMDDPNPAASDLRDPSS